MTVGHTFYAFATVLFLVAAHNVNNSLAAPVAPAPAPSTTIPVVIAPAGIAMAITTKKLDTQPTVEQGKKMISILQNLVSSPSSVNNPIRITGVVVDASTYGSYGNQDFVFPLTGLGAKGACADLTQKLEQSVYSPNAQFGLQREFSAAGINVTIVEIAGDNKNVCCVKGASAILSYTRLSDGTNYLSSGEGACS